MNREADDSGSDSAASGRAEPKSNAARAEAAIRAIAAGADPAAEALSFSNRFTDELASRMRAVFGRRKRSGREPAGSD